MEISQKDYPTLEISPVDRTDAPEAQADPGPINIISDEIQAATEEDLQRIIQEQGRFDEPEIEAYELDRESFSDELAAAARAPYSQIYWTHFDFRKDVAHLVNRIQSQFPFQTYANTYYKHPPIYGRQYEYVSVDFWGGGLDSNGRYIGYRGKPIGTSLGHQVWKALFFDEYKPDILWIIWNDGWWDRRRTGANKWSKAPPGPAGSDAKHLNHVHVTYVL